MKKILLTGGCGFIGHNLALQLKKRGYQVFIIDSLGVNNLLTFTDKEIVNQRLYRIILNERLSLISELGIDLNIIDARDYHAYSKLFSQINPDTVIHLAAVSHASKSNKNPHSTFDHSLRTLENTIDICKNNNTHVIYFSSSMVYGDFEKKSVNENTPCRPLGVYGSLKLAGEIILKSYNQVFELPYTIIRPSALYGERCVSRRVGQIFIENLISNKDIEINGNGDDKLDFTYIDDLINGVVKCIENKNAINETFNITYGEGRKLIDLIEILKTKFNNFKVINKPRDKFVPERGALDISKAKKLLNYKPEFTLEDGYSKYIEWYREFAKSNEFK